MPSIWAVVEGDTGIAAIGISTLATHLLNRRPGLTEIGRKMRRKVVEHALDTAVYPRRRNARSTGSARTPGVQGNTKR